MEESAMLKMIKSTPNYPDNLGKKWEKTEETQLLDELNKNIPISEIALLHNRTPGGITSRIRLIAYNMHIQNISMEKIIEETKLSENEINIEIQKRENRPTKKEKPKDIIKEKPKENKVISMKYSNYEELNYDIREMKSEISQLKSTIQELVEMMKAVYEFEDA
jgi:DNA polymerase II small subunit/DNA polymerase delta subunit B